MTQAEVLAFQRGLPSNIEAEQFVLGSVLLDDSVFPKWQERLRPPTLI